MSALRGFVVLCFLILLQITAYAQRPRIIVEIELQAQLRSGFIATELVICSLFKPQFRQVDTLLIGDLKPFNITLSDSSAG